MKIIIALLIFSFLIIIHELGHYLTARSFKVGINEFSVGMGPKIFSVRSKKTGTAYSLRLILFGGYVSMVGESTEQEEQYSDANVVGGHFYEKSVWQRLIITVAGAVVNIIAGVIITSVIVSTNTNGSTVIYDFTENSVTQTAGLREGDEIVKIGKRKVHTYYDLNYAVFHDAVKPIDVTVIRNGEKTVIHDVEFPTSVVSGTLVANMDFRIYAVKNTFGNVVKQSYYQSITTVKMIWESLFDLVTGKYGAEAVSGPIGVTGAIGDAAEAGTASLFSLTALIAINLGIVNLLPFPGLDGGRIVFLLIELVRRKPLKQEVEGYINGIGLAILMLLMVLISFKDVFTLIK